MSHKYEIANGGGKGADRRAISHSPQPANAVVDDAFNATVGHGVNDAHFAFDQLVAGNLAGDIVGNGAYAKTLLEPTKSEDIKFLANLRNSGNSMGSANSPPYSAQTSLFEEAARLNSKHSARTGEGGGTTTNKSSSGHTGTHSSSQKTLTTAPTHTSPYAPYGDGMTNVN